MELSRTETRLAHRSIIRQIMRHANDAPTRMVAPRQPQIDHFLKRYRASRVNRSGNGQDRQPQKVSRSADGVRFIKPSEKLNQATGFAQVYRIKSIGLWRRRSSLRGDS